MQVVSATGDTSLWVLQCMGSESVRTDLGPVQALKFTREPSGSPHETVAQAWLDPQRHYLPVRASTKSGSEDEPIELRLVGVVGKP